MPDQPSLFPEGAPAAPKLSDVVAMLTKTAEEIRPCRACGAKLFFVRHFGTGALCPYTEMAVSHFTDCPHPERFGRKAQA